MANPTLQTFEKIEKLLQKNSGGIYISQFRGVGIHYRTAMVVLKKLIDERKVRTETRQVNRNKRNIIFYFWNGDLKND